MCYLDRCQITCLVIAGLLATLSISVGISGILGYFDTVEDTCIVTNCTNTNFFYQSHNQTIAHVFIELNRETSGGLSEKNSDYYDDKSDCSQIPEVVKCYYFKEDCYRNRRGTYCTPEKLLPIRQIMPLWSLFFLTLIIPILIIVFSIGSIRKCSICNKCGQCTPLKENIILGGAILYDVIIIIIIVLGCLGFFTGTSVDCLKVNCTLDEDVSGSHVVNFTKITIETTQFDSAWHLLQPQYTYLDHTKNNCKQVDDIIPCYYFANQVSIERIQNTLLVLW